MEKKIVLVMRSACCANETASMVRQKLSVVLVRALGFTLIKFACIHDLISVRQSVRVK